MRDMKIKSAMIGCIVYRGVFRNFSRLTSHWSPKTPYFTDPWGGDWEPKAPHDYASDCARLKVWPIMTLLFISYMSISNSIRDHPIPPWNVLRTLPLSVFSLAGQKKGVKFLPLKCVLLLCLFQCVVNFRKNKGNTRAGAYYGGGNWAHVPPP